MNYKLGAHLSISGGYKKALKKIVKIGGNCLQIFSTSPRGWNFAKINDHETQEFLSLKLKLKIDPIYFHASYLINLADDGKIGHLSKLSIISELSTASKLQIKGSIIHLGSYKGQANQEKYKTLINHILEILDETPDESIFIIENAGNRKIGRTIDEIVKIIKDVNNERIRVCLDICHLHAAGYDLKTSEKLDKFLLGFDKKIGLQRLELWHINDSRDPFGSLRDRHENIGQGTIGINTFKLFLNDQKTKHFPFIIETPGFDNIGPDKKNLDILKTLIE